MWAFFIWKHSDFILYRGGLIDDFLSVRSLLCCDPKQPWCHVTGDVQMVCLREGTGCDETVSSSGLWVRLDMDNFM